MKERFAPSFDDSWQSHKVEKVDIHVVVGATQGIQPLQPCRVARRAAHQVTLQSGVGILRHYYLAWPDNNDGQCNNPQERRGLFGQLECCPHKRDRNETAEKLVYLLQS